ncbi:MAG: hypothetical protein R2764_11025 [Bacteroidales bacterium]
MKKSILSIVFILLIATLFAQKSEENDLKVLMQDLGYSWSETKSTRLIEGESEYFWRTFYSGNEYAILAFSENRGMYDLDLYLYSEEGSLIDNSLSREGFEIIEFVPEEVNLIKIVIKNFECSRSKWNTSASL